MGSDRIADELSLDGPDLAAARALMAGRIDDLRLIYGNDCDSCAGAADIVRENLAAIGLTVHPEAVADMFGEDSDLALWDAWYMTVDPVRFLDSMPGSGFFANLSPQDRALVNQIGFLRGDERINAAAALAERWSVEQAVAIPFAYGVTRAYFSTGVGCQVFPPAIESVDLVNLCPK